MALQIVLTFSFIRHISNRTRKLFPLAIQGVAHASSLRFKEAKDDQDEAKNTPGNKRRKGFVFIVLRIFLLNARGADNCGNFFSCLSYNPRNY